MKSKNTSVYELLIKEWLDANDIIPYIKQFAYGKTIGRKWAADFYIASSDTLLEVNGATYCGYGHGGGDHLMNDYEKWTIATHLGYKLVLLGTGDFGFCKMQPAQFHIVNPNYCAKKEATLKHQLALAKAKGEKAEAKKLANKLARSEYCRFVYLKEDKLLKLLTETPKIKDTPNKKPRAKGKKTLGDK